MDPEIQYYKHALTFQLEQIGFHETRDPRRMGMHQRWSLTAQRRASPWTRYLDRTVFQLKDARANDRFVRELDES